MWGNPPVWLDYTLACRSTTLINTSFVLGSAVGSAVGSSVGSSIGSSLCSSLVVVFSYDGCVKGGDVVLSNLLARFNVA